MTSFLGAISVANRVRILIVVAMLGLAAVAGISLAVLNTSLYESRSDSLRMLVQNAHSIVVRHAGLARDGVLSEEQARERALEALRDLRYDGENYFWVTDTDSKMLMHPFKPELEGRDVSSFKDPNGVRLFAEITTLAARESAGFVSYAWPRPGASVPADKLSYVESYRPWGWVVGTGVYIDDIAETFWGMFTKLLAAFAVITGLMLAGGALIGRSVTVPLKRMAEIMNHVQQTGRIGARVKMSQKAEMGAIGDAFDGMLEGLGQFVDNIRISSDKLAVSAESLAAVAEQTNVSIHEQRLQTTQVATAMTEMSATVAEIAGSTAESAEVTRDVDQASEQGQQVMAENLSAIDALAGGIEMTNGIVERLSENTESVGTVLDVIGGIAEQTNLLALNAAIEAARAGEQGRGFAVVADEVRHLAQRTQDSTQEIQKIINSVQAAAREVVEAMHQGRQQAGVSVEHAGQAKQKLSEISNAVSRIKDMTLQIATAAEQQSAVANDVTQNVSQIDVISEQNVSGAEQIAHASRELSHLAEALKQQASKYDQHAA